MHILSAKDLILIRMDFSGRNREMRTTVPKIMKLLLDPDDGTCPGIVTNYVDLERPFCSTL